MAEMEGNLEDWKGEDERIGGKENGVVAEMEGNLGDWKGRR